MTLKAIHQIGLQDGYPYQEWTVDQEKMGNFLNKITQTYFQGLSYHNDLHGADVMQMSYYFLTTGRLSEIILLSKLDQLAVLVAAACHDLGHDGLNNNFHINAITKRAIDSNDVSIQENYHASEMFRILA